MPVAHRHGARRGRLGQRHRRRRESSCRMTGGAREPDRRGALQNPVGPQATRSDEPARTRGPATASHAITVLIPDERPALIRYGAAVAATAIALAVTLPAASLLERVVFVLF